MEDEPASEAIDRDVDHIDDEPDSMELLMGEMEMPFEPHCDIIKSCEIRKTLCTTVSPCSLSPSFNEIVKSKGSDTENKQELNKFDSKYVLIKSFKECTGFATVNLLDNESVSTHGFVGTGELKRTLSGNDPLDGLKEWLVTISSYSIEHALENVEEMIDDGFPHFIQSLNQLENLAVHKSPESFPSNGPGNMFNGLKAKMINKNEWTQISDELHDFLTHLRRSSYLVKAAATNYNNGSVAIGEVQITNEQISLARSTQDETKSAINLKTIISKFLHSLYWLKAEVGSVQDLFEEGATLRTENNSTNAASAFLHVILTIQFTLLSCVQFLKLALGKIEQRWMRNSDQMTMTNGNNEEQTDYVVPRFDSLFFSKVFCSGTEGQQEHNEVFENYELSSCNIEKVLRLLIKQLVQDLSLVAKDRFKQTEKIFNSLRSASSVFGCGCIQELFSVLYHFANKYCPKQFWVLLSCCVQIQQKQCNNEDGSIQQVYRFFWTFVHHFFPLIMLDQRGKCIIKNEKILDDKYMQRCNLDSKKHDIDDRKNYTNATAEELLEESKEVILVYLRNTLKLLDEKFLEQDLRTLLSALIQVSNISRIIVKHGQDENSIANVVALSLLWDFFIKRLNNHFKAPVAMPSVFEEKNTSNLARFTVLATSHMSWISIVRETILLKKDDNGYADTKEKEMDFNSRTANLNTYYLFVKLIAVQLGPCLKVSKQEVDTQTIQVKSKAAKAVKQFVGRLRSKLPASKIQSLEEIGLHYLLTLFIALILGQQGDECDNLAGIVSIAEAVLGLAKEEIKPDHNVASRKLTTYLRGLASVFVLLLQTLQNQVSKFGCKTTLSDDILKERKKLTDLMKSFVNVLAQRVESAIDAYSPHVMDSNKLSFSTADNAVKVYAELLQDPICLASPSFFLSQANLVHAGLGKYLQQKQRSSSGTAEIKNVLISLIAVTTRIRRYYQQIERNGFMSLSVEEREIKEGIDETCLNLWRNVYPVIKGSLCTNSLGDNGGLGITTANQVAEFIIAMTLLSQSLASSSCPPNAYVNNPIESFPEMFKYYSHSPVVHPSVACAFLFNVVQNNKRGFELDATQVLLLLKGWVRCSTLLLSGDETLVQLSQYILPLCKELSHTYDPHVDKDYGIATFLIAVSKLYIRDNFCPAVRKRYEPIFESYIDCINRNFQQILNSGSQLALHRLYAVGSLLVKHCARLLYVEKLVNRLQPIVQRLFTSSAMLKEDFNMTNDMKFATSRSLPDFIRGICTLQHLQTDQFAIRTLKCIYITYLHRFEINELHPFIVTFKKPMSQIDSAGDSFVEDFPMSCFVNFNEMYAQFFKTIRNEFLSKQPNQKHRLKLKHTLEFVLVLIKIIPEMSVFAVQTIFSAILDIRLTLSTDDYGVKNISAELITLLVKVGHSDRYAGQNESGLSHAIVRGLEQLINSHLGFYVDETFQVLTALSTLDKKLVGRLMPNIEVAVQDIEKKRGIQASGDGMFQRRLNELKRRVQH